MAGSAPEPVAPGALPVIGAPDGGLSTTTGTVSSNRSWLGALFAGSDMTVDSLIVIMAISVVAFWIICGFQVVTGREVSSPMALGTGFAAMLAAFGGSQTLRGRFGQSSGGS